MVVIYVAGPLHADNGPAIERNIKRASDAALEIWRLGAAALCPHTNSGVFHGRLPEKEFVAGSLDLLRRCDAIYFCEGWEKSPGSLGEMEEAKRLKMAILFELDHVREYVLDSQKNEKQIQEIAEELRDFETKIPDGQTCLDCIHIQRCTWLLQRQGTEVNCDWIPSRFIKREPGKEQSNG